MMKCTYVTATLLNTFNVIIYTSMSRYAKNIIFLHKKINLYRYLYKLGWVGVGDGINGTSENPVY